VWELPLPNGPETAFACIAGYQPPPVFFLFDQCAFPAPLATSCWSLNPALHGGILTPP
jgi:hypothetical protein